MQPAPHLDKRALGYLRIGDNPRVLAAAEALWIEACELIDITRWKECVSVDEFFSLFHACAGSSQAVHRLLGDSQNVWMFAVTIGLDLELRSKDYMKTNEVLRGYLLSRIGSYLVEAQVRCLDKEIAECCRRGGLTTTRRYSPGYGDFSLEAQKIFVALAQDGIPALRVDHSGLILPEKTVTAIKGVVHPPSVD
jgi:hypothetical protein